MVATRILVLVLAGLLWAPNAFAQSAPYEFVPQTGVNNILDITAFGACQLGVGCRDIDGNICPSGTPGVEAAVSSDGCKLERVPAGRCSRGSSTSCIWPLGAGTCSGDPNRGCQPSLGGADCPSGTCDPLLNDPNCVCTPATEASVCGGSQGICSDGDQDPAVLNSLGGVITGTYDEPRLGAAGTSLCTEITIASASRTNCGKESGQDKKGVPFGIENVPLTPVPQRTPGLQGTDTGPIVHDRFTNVFTWGVPDANGVRRFVNEGDAQWSDWTYSNRKINGAPVSSSIVTYYCDLPGGWKTDQTFTTGTGTCATGGAACQTNVDCGSNGPCNDTNGDRTCYSSNNKIDNFGWVWTTSFTGTSGGPCPPNCGTSYDFSSLENDALVATALQDPKAGIQLAMNNLTGALATLGDAVSATNLVSFTWIGDPDLRCLVNGADATDSSLGWVGRCADTAIPSELCNPDTQKTKSGVTGGGGIPGECDCRRCNATQDQAGLCADLTTTCQVDGDCGASTPCSLTGVPDSGRNQPDGFNDHGFPQASANHRVGGIGGQTWTVRVPLTLLGTTGDNAVMVRDNDSKSLADTNNLGPVQFGTGGAGIGTGGTFQNGVTTFPAFPGATCCASGADIIWAAENPGIEQGLLHRTVDWLPGADQLQGCIGDSSNTSEPPGGTTGPCTDALGSSVAGNTGIDDIQATVSIGTGCVTTCVGPSDPATGTQGKLCGAFGNPPTTCAAGLVCACSGIDATLFDADSLPDPASNFPTLRTVVSGTALDLTVLSANNTDAVFKVRTLSCPYVGHCTTGGEQCVTSAECANGGDTCDNIALTCAEAVTDPCAALGGDTDGDGICDDGDGSGTPGDNTCLGGATAGCDDNCVVRANPTQSDVGGPGGGVPDGVGDACQCGDINGDGKINNTDKVILARFIGGLPPGVNNLEKCTVSGTNPDRCNNTDKIILSRFIGGLPPGVSNVCRAFVGP